MDYRSSDESNFEPRSVNEVPVSNGKAVKWTRGSLTADEIRVLDECRRESYKRSLPLAGIAMMATHVAVKTGYLMPHPRWGSAIKVIGAGFVGFIVGRVSYISKYEEKLMSLPNSPIGETLRRRRGIISREGLDDTVRFESGDVSTDSHSHGEQYRRSEGLDDIGRPSLDRNVPMPEVDPEGANKQTTYEELRRKNREEYEKKQSPMYRFDQPPPQRPSPEPPAKKEFPTPDSRGKNLYGDVWET